MPFVKKKSFLLNSLAQTDKQNTTCLFLENTMYVCPLGSANNTQTSQYLVHTVLTCDTVDESTCPLAASNASHRAVRTRIGNRRACTSGSTVTSPVTTSHKKTNRNQPL